MNTALIPFVVIACFLIMIFIAIWRYVQDCRRATRIVEPCVNALDELFDRIRWDRNPNARSLEMQLNRSGMWDILLTLERLDREHHLGRYAICNALNAMCKHDMQWIAIPTGYGLIFNEPGLQGMISWSIQQRSSEASEGYI